jgi:hypothetical protein
MNKLPTHRRSPLLSTLIFIVVLTAGLLLIALLQLDIGSYKQQLASQLEQALNKPVKLGDAELSFHNGIALDFRNLRIGTDDNFSLHVPQLTTTLNPLELIQGEIVIEQVLLDAPNLRFSLPLSPGKSTTNLDQLGLKTLQIRKGSLTVFRADRQEQPLRVSNFNLVIHGLGKGLVSQLATTATLSQTDQNAEFNLFLELTRQQRGQAWRQGQLRGNISLKNLQHNLLRKRISPELPGQFDLAIGIEGIPADKVRLETSVNDSNNGKSLLSLASDWRSAPRNDSLHNLRLRLADIPLTGQLRLNRKGPDPQLSGRLELNNTQLKTLLARVRPLAKLSGQIEKLEIAIQGPLHATAENPLSPLRSAYLKLNNLSYPLGLATLSDTSMLIELQNARLNLKEGRGTIAQTPFTFSGATGLLNRNPPELALTLNGTADLRQLQSKFSSPFLRRQKLTGKAPLNLVAQGPLGQLAAKLKIDLSKTDLTIGKLLSKTQDTPASIELKGQITPDLLTLNKAQLKIAQSSVQLTGGLVRSNNRWSGELQLAPLRLETLQPHSPIFAFFKINGETQGQLKLGANGWKGQLNLSNGGAHLTNVLSDLNQVNGVLQLNKNGFDLGTLQGRLGRSPLTIGGGLRNWRLPLLSLQVASKELRAQDLIFTNRQMMLQDLTGQLLINAGGITFDQIQVTVADSSTARIEGQMRDYRNPHTYLEISSDKANILDVIQLFNGPPRFKKSGKKRNKASLEIKTRVAQGSLGSFTFENAEGTINDRNGIFTLFPLDLKLGEGRASGRVEIDRRRNNLLKISGHAQNCDADSVYEMLFEKRGIFRGNLSGDFYIEGEEIGEQFWKTSKGGGHLQIKDGAMRELKSFARIFSLLNVSQLFTFNLPDMDEEGLPFSLLETSARITEGIIHFDDFSISSPAINISAVGQIDSLRQTIDTTLGIKPLRTVDIILSQVPLFGWVLTGEEEALVTALFNLKGPLENPKVNPAPVSSVTRTALGIIGRTLGLPFRMLQKTGEFLTTPSRPDEEPLPQEEERNN